MSTEPKVVKSLKYKGATINVRWLDETTYNNIPLYDFRVKYPDGREAFNSKKHESVSSAIARAKVSINDGIERDRKEAIEAKKTPTQKDKERFNKHVSFFKKHAGSSYNPKTQTKAQGQLEGAKRLAKAEQYAEDHGWEVHWMWDEGADPAEHEGAKEIYVAILKDSNGKTLGSLGGISDPDNNYRRVVDAELALDAMPR